MPYHLLFDINDGNESLEIYGKISRGRIHCESNEDPDQLELNFPFIEKVQLKYKSSHKSFTREFDVREEIKQKHSETINENIYIVATKKASFKDIIIHTSQGIVNLHLYVRSDSYGILVSTDIGACGGRACVNAISSPTRKENKNLDNEQLSVQHFI